MHRDNTLIYTALISLGVQKAAAESLAKNYDPADGISPEIYARGAAEAFFYGKGSFPEAELLNGKGLAPVLTELQRSTAYRLGQIFQERQTTKEEAAIAQKKAAAKKSGSVAQSQKGNVYYDGDHSRLTERQKVSVRALEKLAQALGVDFYLYESERDATGKPIGANGWYDQKTGDIHIDLNAGELGEGTILFTAAHELTHFLRQWSPSKFKVLSDFLVEQYGAKGQSVADLVRNQQAKAKRNGRSLSWMQAYEEMVADSMETMLSDGTVIEKLTELSAKDKGLVQKLLVWFKGFAAKLKRAYKDLSADSAEGRLVAEMTDTIDRLQTLFTEGLAQAGENYRMVGGQKNSAQEEKTVVYYCQRSPKLVSETEVKTLLDKVKCKEISGHGYIPIRISTPGIVQERLFAEDIPMVMPVSKAYQAMSADLGPKKGKNVRGHDLSPQDLVEIIKRMDSPDYVFSQPKNDRGIEVIKYGTPEGNIAVIIEFSNNINPAYLNGYKGGAYNIAITAFEIDGGAVGLFQYAKEQEWQEVFNKEKEGNPAKKFPTTRPFAIEQDFPDNSIPHESDGVNKYSDRDSTEPRLDSNVQDDAAKEQRSAQEQPTVHSLLMDMDVSKVKNATERKYLKEYQETATRQLAEQQKLDKLQAELDALPKEKRQTSRARFLRDEIIKTKNRLQICQSIQTRLETDSPLTYLINRDINPRLAEAQKTAMPQIQTGVANLEQSDIIKQKSRQKRSVAREITEDAIHNIPHMSYSGLTNEASQLLYEQQQLLLREAMELPKGTEVAFICNLAGVRQWKSVGSIGHASVPEVHYEHLILHNHPDCRIFSGTDIEALIMRAETKGIFAIGNDGSVYSAIKQDNYDGYAAYESFKTVNIALEKFVAAQDVEGYISAIRKYLKEAKKFGIEFDEKTAGGT